MLFDYETLKRDTFEASLFALVRSGRNKTRVFSWMMYCTTTLDHIFTWWRMTIRSRMLRVCLVFKYLQRIQSTIKITITNSRDDMQLYHRNRNCGTFKRKLNRIIIISISSHSPTAIGLFSITLLWVLSLLYNDFDKR